MRIISKEDSESSLTRTIGIAVAALATVGLDRIGAITLTPYRMSLEPKNLADGEDIARALGCTSALDHHILTPGFTDWTGQLSDLEVHVRATLRRPAGVRS